MNLYILRHGLAADPGSPGVRGDAKRPLTAEGKQKLRRVAKAIEVMGIEFDLVLTSPYVRALETAELVAKALHVRKRVECTEHLIPGASLLKLIETINLLRPEPSNLLLVGHEPDLSRLISLLIAGDAGAAIDLKKAGFARLSVDTLRDCKCASLDWLLTPRMMKLMARAVNNE